jgi:hypothetical protein
MQVDPIAAAIALIALGVAVWANVIARTAANASRTSADEARRSSDAAIAANELTRDEVLRDKELHDVEWRIEESQGGLLRLRNVGTSTAFSVSALVRVEEQRFDVVGGDVDTDGTLTCDAASVYQSKHDENRRLIQAMSQSGIAYFPSGTVTIEARVTWQSAMGTPGVQIVTNESD